MPPREIPKPIDWSAQPLGKEPDTAIAKRLGVTVSAVTRARGRRRIKPYYRPGSRVPKRPQETLAKRVCVSWDPEQLQQVRDLGYPLSAVVREAVDLWLASLTAPAPDQPRAAPSE